jgi:tRNA 2-thiouridine synthesizing protein E
MKPQVDSEGFLKNLDDWTPAVAEILAKAEGIELSDAHWHVVHMVRNYYDAYRISPAARIIVKLMKDSDQLADANSIYLMSLFTGRPARQANKIAGLPKPTNCD